MAPLDHLPVTVSPTVMARVCGIPVRALGDVATPQTVGRLRDARSQAQKAENLSGPLADELYRLVPRLDADRAARRATMGLRRDVHNGRLTPKTEDMAGLVADRLDQGVRDQLAGWLDARRRHAECLASAAEKFGPELDAAGRTMLRCLRQPRIAGGLALASPSFTTELLSTEDAEGCGGQLSVDSRLARAAISYLSRAATKTSPFSTLTTVGVARFAGRSAVSAAAVPTAPTGASDRDVNSSGALAVALLRACLRHPEAAAVLRVAGHRGVRRIAGGLFATLPVYAAPDGVFIRDDELTDCGLYEWVLPYLPDRPTSLAELAEPPWDLGPELVVRLAEMGLLQLITPWAMTESRRLRPLATFVGERATPALAPLVSALGTLADSEEAVADCHDGGRRIEAIHTARASARQAFASLGQPSPEWLASAPLFHEVVATRNDCVPALPDALRDDVAEAARWVPPAMVRTPIYDGLVQMFVAHYGAGGVCDDLVGFLYSCLAGIDLSATPGARPGPPQDLRGHGTLGQASAAMFFQVAAQSSEAILAGRHQLVVNLVHGGTGWLVSRWATVPSLRERLESELPQWLGSVYPGCRVHQVTASPDWASLQRPTIRTLPRVRWPSDLPPDGDDADVDLRGMTLTHDPATATLQAYDRDGEPAAFAYLGTVPLHLLDGPMALLCVLSDPWIVLGRVDRDIRPTDKIDDAPEVTFRPRIQHGRTVWARARWSVPASKIPRPQAGSSPVSFLGEMEEWRTRHGLPEEVFVADVRRGVRGVERGKPHWLRFDHPYALWATLRQLRSDAPRVELVEALPGSTQHWARDDADNPVASELVGLVRYG